ERGDRLELLPARSRNKAPDLRPTFIVLVRPNYGQPELVWHSYQSFRRYLDPLAVKPHPILSILRIPIHICNALTIGICAAKRSSAREAVEPLLERRV